jgi:multicomponent Na+:H+ antiporter subunit B
MFSRVFKLALCILGAIVVSVFSFQYQFSLGAPLKTFYNENFRLDTGATNAVTAIYLNYRVFDTFFETLMLILSVMAVIYLSWRNGDEK